MMKYLFCFLAFFSKISYSQPSDPFSKVNSPYDEQDPVISPDGKTLFITVARHPQNIGGKRDLGDIWISIKEGDTWSVPVHGGRMINNSSYNSVAGMSKDGSELYLLSHYKTNGSAPSTQGISVSRRTNMGWSVPQNITIPYFLNRSTTLDGYWHEDKSVLIFSAESHTTLGAEDLYVSFKRNGNWTELTNLGNVVNTPMQEMSPSLNADGTKLFFASNGRGNSLGSFDIYESDRLDDSWTSWSEPVNLSSPINSEGRELYYREFQAQGFSLYTSTRNSDGYGDVRMMIDNTKLPIENTLPVEIAPPIVAANAIFISGRVSNSKSGEGIPARLIFRSDSTYTTNGSPEGSYGIGLKREKIYAIEVDAEGFVNMSERLDIQSITNNMIEMNFKLQPIEVGAVVNLKSVLFNLGSTNLIDESYDELNVVVDFLTTNPKVEIELEGHTDNRGDEDKNLTLSQQRVDKIKSYLVSKGISGKRISGEGYGGSRPIATSNSEEARKLNRRVEFRIVKN